MSASTPDPGKPIRECECIDLGETGRPLPAAARGWARFRSLLKARHREHWSLWDLLTTLLDRIGLTLQTVQVLCIDAEAGRVLILITDEYDSGLSPIQGLRKQHRFWPLMGRDRGDARIDARTELTEEGVLTLLALERFVQEASYREGVGRQFACRVFVVECRTTELTLRPETAEGMSCWAQINDAIDWLDNPELTRILQRYISADPERSTPHRQ
jgi:hypothetical protein